MTKMSIMTRTRLRIFLIALITTYIPLLNSFTAKVHFPSREQNTFGKQSRKESPLSTTTSTRLWENKDPSTDLDSGADQKLSAFEKLKSEFSVSFQRIRNFDVEDTQVLFYDVFLLLNLSVSVSFWVIHRGDPFPYIANSLSEGALLSILWISAGLANGMFLYEGYESKTNGNYEPKSVGMQALNSFVSVCNMRIILALIKAVLGHRHVGDIDEELLVPLELGGGIVMMSFWRMLYSTYVTR